MALMKMASSRTYEVLASILETGQKRGQPLAMFMSLTGLWKEDELTSGLKASITCSRLFWSSSIKVTWEEMMPSGSPPSAQHTCLPTLAAQGEHYANLHPLSMTSICTCPLASKLRECPLPSPKEQVCAHIPPEGPRPHTRRGVNQERLWVSKCWIASYEALQLYSFL